MLVLSSIFDNFSKIKTSQYLQGNTSIEVFPCKYWLVFIFEKLSKIEERTNMEVLLDKQFSFLIDRIVSNFLTSIKYFLIKNFPGSLPLEYSWKD